MIVLGLPLVVWCGIVLTIVVVALLYLALRSGSSEEKTPLLPKLPNGSSAYGVWVETSYGRVLRASEASSKLLAHPDRVTTMAEAWALSSREYADRPCMGVRELIDTESTKDASGRVIEKLTLGEYRWSTYRTVAGRVENFGAGLAALGHQRGERVAIYAETSDIWQMTAQACFCRAFPVATVYPSLGGEAANYAFREAECTTVVVDAKLVRTLRPTGRGPAALPPCVQRVVYIGRVDPEEIDARVQTLSWEQVEHAGGSKPSAARGPSPQDICVVMYTSGSTGQPKGVLIAHSNLIAVQAAVRQFVHQDDSYLAYLPLAHVLELAAETAFLGMGLRIGYGTPLTLTDNSPKIKHGTKGDATMLRPTLMAAVPAIMDRIRRAVSDKVEASSWLSRHVFHWAYDLKIAAVKRGRKTPLLDRFFARTAAILGGRVRLLISGGAPLSVDTELFMNVCFKCKVGQGYGLTETCGMATIVRPQDHQVGHVGAPVSCCELRLVDYAEGGYTSADQPYPRGEIVLGGHNITQGYMNDPTKTSEVFKKENGQMWFYTGDIGMVRDDGTVCIVDRKKDLVKLSHGEYIALGKIESVIAKSPLVESVCVYADSFHGFPIAIIVPIKKKLAEAIGAPDADSHELCSRPEAAKALLDAIERVAREEKLHKTEVPAKVILTAEPWTAETGMVTAALKLRRENIKKAFAKEIEAAYK